MAMDFLGRREFLRTVGSVGLMAGVPALAEMSAIDPASVAYEVAQPDQNAEAAPKHSIKFAVCGMSHDHIYGMVGAIQRGGGVLVAAYGAEPDKLANFKKRFPDVKMVSSEDAILNDPSIQLVLSSTIPDERAPLGVRVMKKGKDYLSDKPGATSLEQIDEIRKTIAETKRIYGILYSERFEVKAAVKAGDMVKAGAIGRVIQTINIAPHQIVQHGMDPYAGGAGGRPDWFWDPARYGGILTDIGSHQVDQFLFYTGSTQAEVVASQVANVNHHQKPKFQDFGDMMLRGDRGFGYVRLDWFTPDGLGTWGDGRLFILGTEGYIEVRKYVDVARSKQGNNLFIVDKNQQRFIDCNNVTLPFGAQFVSDVVNRTHTAQDQTQCLLAAELVVRAQMKAQHVTLKS
ncbi:Gfo/Idh/MocA family protein [Edaphobacter sp. 12200R-103]|jgi:predicted dehydrogenase|uniref:Gfo/Idh/MocA family protein n=1 Tax=Edaphobacter sp. 12200R-103 TaxID=2703788 RepID=UPI00138C04F7|nr:Gfo/Idh/MocA family oxidoreductase [Edaphobacter sp. 12200R-103]QHS51704.1 Gfo/Idh/MocA family oxidoreductase [Edaphobacter sp. 12200R-103]